MHQFILHIKDLIKDGKLKQALQELIDTLRNSADDTLFNEVILLNAQIREAEKNLQLQLIDFDKYLVIATRISNAVLDEVLEQLEHPPAHVEAYSGVPTSGKLLHNIPRKMTVGVMSRCTVRIAADETQLLKGFEKTPDTVITDIEMAKIMEVRVAPESAANFQVEELSTPEQSISATRANEWKFLVTPLREGTHRLLLRVMVVEIIGEKEFRRDTILEQDVLISSDIPETIEQTSTWSYGNVMFTYTSKRKGAPFWKAAAKIAAAAATLTGVAIAAWVFLKSPSTGEDDPGNYSKGPTQVPPGSWTISLQYDEALLVEGLRIDGETKSFQRKRPGELSLYLPGGAKVYDINVTGRNGSCSRKAYITRDAEAVKMLCTIDAKKDPDIGKAPPVYNPPPNNTVNNNNKPDDKTTPNNNKPDSQTPPNNQQPPVQKNTFTVTLQADAAFNGANVYLSYENSTQYNSGVQLGMRTKTVAGARLENLKPGKYDFIIQNKSRGSCVKSASISANTTVIFDDCPLEVSLIVKDALADNIQLNVDKRATKNFVKGLDGPNGPTRITVKVPAAGEHTFEILEATHICSVKADVRRSGQSIDMPCQTVRQKPVERQMIIQLDDSVVRKFISIKAQTALIDIGGVGQKQASIDYANKQVVVSIPADRTVPYFNVLYLNPKTGEQSILCGNKPADNLQSPLTVSCGN